MKSLNEVMRMNGLSMNDFKLYFDYTISTLYVTSADPTTPVYPHHAHLMIDLTPGIANMNIKSREVYDVRKGIEECL